MTTLLHSNVRRRAITAMGLSALVFGAVGANAAPNNSPIASLQDDRLSGPQGADPRQRLGQAAALGAKVVRVDLQWHLVATKRPTNAENPADPAYDWRWYDRVVDAANLYGVKILFTAWSTPDWAADPSLPLEASAGTIPLGSHSRRPANAADFGAFGRAAAARYAPKGVHLWEAWNEPNIPRFLRPQFEKVGNTFQNVSVRAYSDLAKAFYQGVKAADPAATVAGGVTAPAGDKCPPSCPAGEHSRTPPNVFLQELGKPGLQPPMDVVSHHPYPLTLPRPGSPKTASFIDLYNLKALTAAVDGGYLKGKTFWLTEFGFATEPVPDYKSLIVNGNQQAALLSDAYGRVRQNPRVGLFTWYFLQDGLGWRSGLYDQAGTSKPANVAFKMPLAASAPTVRRGKRVQLLGQVRPATGATKVAVQARAGKGKFKTIRTLTTTADGSYQITVTPKPPTSYRAVWTSPQGETLTSFAATVGLDTGKKAKKKKGKRR